MSGVRRLLRVGRNVTDLDRAGAFYTAALGFSAVAVADDPGWARLLGARMSALRLRLGGQQIELAQFDPPGAPYPPDSTSADLWFQHLAIVTDDIAAAATRVLRHGAVAISRDGPQRLPASAGGVTAFKFRDPDGHPLELIHFPAAPAPPQAGEGRLTLGIDHSAISVAEAGRSRAFYTGVLGLPEASRQVNRGPAQELLDALDGDVVDVVALRPTAAATPHVELLGYRTPRGRPAPAGQRPTDIAADRLVLEVDGLGTLVQALAAAGRPVVAPVSLAGGDDAVLARDPDGHHLVLVEGRGAAPNPAGA